LFTPTISDTIISSRSMQGPGRLSWQDFASKGPYITQ
jgi:hypothetical protein